MGRRTALPQEDFEELYNNADQGNFMKNT